MNENENQPKGYDYKWGFSEPAEQAKRSIIIERPNGQIPGLIEVNEILAKHFGCVVVISMNRAYDDGTWVVDNFELHKARIEGDTIVPYALFEDDET